MKHLPKFWPLDLEPEDQIYDNPSWDLPGLRRTRSQGSPANPRKREKQPKR
jgi:hypothetical protein